MAKCYKCHNSKLEKPKGGLLLDSRVGLRKGGESGPALVPGSTKKSLLIKAIRYTDPDLQMPPKGQLSAAQVKDFETWIRLGAPDPREGNVLSSKLKIQGPPHWSFKPLTKAAPPAVTNTAWVKTEVDRFILAELEEKKMAPVGPADKRTLIRRAAFDLIGLPPTLDEVEAFLKDQSPNAFEKVVDHLLASPHYGERWGRHWLDLARYADTSGCNSDFPVPTAYKCPKLCDQFV